jgi:hypothetical protein
MAHRDALFALLLLIVISVKVGRRSVPANVHEPHHATVPVPDPYHRPQLVAWTRDDYRKFLVAVARHPLVRLAVGAGVLSTRQSRHGYNGGPTVDRHGALSHPRHGGHRRIVTGGREIRPGPQRPDRRHSVRHSDRWTQYSIIFY